MAGLISDGGFPFKQLVPESIAMPGAESSLNDRPIQAWLVSRLKRPVATMVKPVIIPA
ncbi:MAG: hypothetical protein JPMHGGIA_02092 [Saprospiraceae bacterium]|jgi:hypothetical protein|nr:hypothetical protein [Saprospiraceae bacterium]